VALALLIWWPTIERVLGSCVFDRLYASVISGSLCDKNDMHLITEVHIMKQATLKQSPTLSICNTQPAGLCHNYHSCCQESSLLKGLMYCPICQT
jgi:hypothetical protein